MSDAKDYFLGNVQFRATEFRQKSFEACMESFIKTVVKKSTEIDVPDEVSTSDKVKLANEVKTSIDAATTQIVTNAKLNDETSSYFNVNLAGEITNPKNISENIGKMIAGHVYEESADRECTLESLWGSGYFKGKDEDDVSDYVKKTFESLMFDSKFDNGKNCARGIKNIFSIEGDELVESIKSDVSDIVSKTEEKNSVIRSAISEINDKKIQIEEEINGENSRIKSTNTSDDESENENSIEEDDVDADGGPEESPEFSGEAFKRKGAKKSSLFSKEDFVYSINNRRIEMGTESLSFLDKETFSREAAEEILSQFRQLDDNIDTTDIPANSNTFSKSEDDGGDDDTGGDAEDQSAEYNDYGYDDDDEPIEIDPSAFADKETIDGIQPDMISEESLIRELFPLSINKMSSLESVVNRKNLTAFLACKPSRGEEFFNQASNRSFHLTNMMSNESIADEDPINKKIQDNLKLCEHVKSDVDTLVMDMGILGIIDGKYQRTENPIDNAVKSLVNPNLISKESLEENEYAEIFKLVLKLGDLNTDIANGIDVIGKRDQLGYIEELLNEKIFNIEDDLVKLDVESKVKALQSIESVCPFQDIVNMQVFVSNSEGIPKPDKITLESLKDIDAYGYSYIDEITKIKKDLVEKCQNDSKNSSGSTINVNIEAMVEYIVEHMDTTAFDPTIYEKVITKLVSDKVIESSAEAWIIRNKAKIITTSFIVADKLGYFSKEDINQIQYDLM